MFSVIYALSALKAATRKKKAALTRKRVVYVVVTCKRRSAGHGGPGIRLDACNHLLILSKIYIKGSIDII